MDYDVYLHDLVELVVIFKTSPSASKTDSECLSYCVFDVGEFIGLSCREVSHLSPHNIFSLGDTQYFCWKLRVVIFPTKLVSSCLEFGCSRYHSFSFGCFS